MTDISNVARLSEPLKFAYWVPNVSGGLVVSTIEQRTGWDFDYNKKLARIAENSGFEYALTQTRYAASYGADKQHEATSFSLALLAATERLKVISAVHPGMWHPGVLAKYIITADHISNGRAAVNIVSGWLKDEFTNFGLEWLEHDERYVRTEEFIKDPPRALDRAGVQPVRQVLQHQQLHPAAGPGGRAGPGAPGDFLRRELHRSAGHGRPGGGLVLLQRQGPGGLQGEHRRRRRCVG